MTNLEKAQYYADKAEESYKGMDYRVAEIQTGLANVFLGLAAHEERQKLFESDIVLEPVPRSTVEEDNRP